jgi:hypothetical protein
MKLIPGNIVTITQPYYTSTSANGISSSYFNLFSGNGFAKNSRNLDCKSFIILLETIKVDDYSQYMKNIADTIMHPGFRQLTDEYLSEIVLDIEKAEKALGFNIEDHYNLDNFPSFKLLKKIK